MTLGQEEALYEFLDTVTGTFELDEVVSYLKKIGPGRINRLAAETADYINFRNLAFPAGRQRWVSRRGFFEPLVFVISPTRLELVNGILIPGHRCVPFANPGLLPQEYSFTWQGSVIPFTSTEGAPDEFYPFYSILGEEYAPQYVARDNDENEEAFNSDPYDDPPEVSIRTLDMRNIYREASFVPGDRFIARTSNWRAGVFELKKVSKGEWNEAELLSWQRAAEEGFQASFNSLGPASCTEEQIAYAYWHGNSRMREIPAYSLEEFLYEKTDTIETVAYGIETRFWYTGREIPDLKELDLSGMRPDKNPIEEILCKIKIPVSEFVILSYIRDSLFREDGDTEMILKRLIPESVEIDSGAENTLAEYIDSVLSELRDYYSPFSDKTMGPIRQRAAELHTAVIDLAARLNRGGIDITWLPRHSFIILSQIQSHTAGVLEDLDSDDSLSQAELDAIDSSLDSMIETYDDLKELIDEALNSYRRNKLSVIRAGSSIKTVTERLIQLSIGGIDVWRRIIISENCSLEELHQIIQTVFDWRDSQDFRFLSAAMDDGDAKKALGPKTRIKMLDAKKINELLYEYGAKWTVRIIILSGNETPVSKPVRCVAGAGIPPPEFVGGPMRFRRVIAALESGNDIERLGARQELGPDFYPGEFDMDACNRNLYTWYQIKGRNTDD